MQLSVMLNNFHLPFEAALDAAIELGIPAVQLTVGADDDIAQMARAVRERGLEVSALSCDIGDMGAGDAPQKIEAAKPLIEAAAKFGNGIFQTHVGVMPHGASGARWDAFVRSGEALANFANECGACVALETGPEPARVMGALMETVNSPGLRVNYDPANLILWPAMLHKFPHYLEEAGIENYHFDREASWADFEPVEGVKRLAPYIAHVHAKDGVGDGSSVDVPLGEGWVDWPEFLGLLRQNGYDGFLAIEREGGEDRVAEIAHAARFLRAALAGA